MLLGGAAALGAFFWADVAVAGGEPSSSTRRARRTESRIGPGNWIALLPIYGSIQQIRHAESYFQRVLGVGFLALDMVSLGTGAQAAALWFRSAARSGA